MTDETLPPSVDAATAEAEPLALAHTINGASLAGITFKNALLTILTLGIWSFWAKTRVRRYLWRREIENDGVYVEETRPIHLADGRTVFVKACGPPDFRVPVAFDVSVGVGTPCSSRRDGRR